MPKVHQLSQSPKSSQQRRESLITNGWIPASGDVFTSRDHSEIAVVLVDGSYYRGVMEATGTGDSNDASPSNNQ